MNEIIQFPMDRIKKPRNEAEGQAEELSQYLELKTQMLSDRLDQVLEENGVSTEAPCYSKEELETIKAISQAAMGIRPIDWNGHIPYSGKK